MATSDLNEQCWNVIGALGADDHSYFSPDAVERLTEMGIVETDVDGKLRLTSYGERAYVALESGDDFPGLE